MNKNSGITLVALVITIIVMLILAGVSLSATVGENGVITRARAASEMQRLAQIKEEFEMNKVARFIEQTGSLSSNNEYWIESTDASQYINVSEQLATKMEVQEGKLVYNPDLCTEEEKSYFEGLGITSGNFVVQGIQVNISGAENAKTVVGPNIAICLDASGSMQNTRIDNAKQAIINMLESSFSSTEDTKTLFSVVTFNNDADFSLKVVDGVSYRNGAGIIEFEDGKKYASTYSDIQFLKSVINTLQTKSGYFATYMERGLIEANKALQSMNEKYVDNVDFIVFLSDGAPNDSNVNNIYNRAQEYKDKGVYIYTIGYGISANSTAHNVLKKIATNESMCTLAGDGNASSIISAFEGIKRKIDNVTTGINTDRGILTLNIQVGCKINPNKPIIITIQGVSTEYSLNNLPSTIMYDEQNNILKWNIRGYTQEQIESLDISFEVVPK